MTDAIHPPQNAPDELAAALRVETRPQRLIAARYAELPAPAMGPMQEVALDVGITAYHGTLELAGLVFKGYHEHQLLFEQRWPARVIQARTGEENLVMEAGTGIAVRGLHFMLHAYEPLTMLEVTAVAKPADGGETVQGLAHVPVIHHEQQTDLYFPLRGAWWTIQAGDWSDLHKMEAFSQAYALDFVKLGPDNRYFSNDGHALEDHYSWNQPVYATAGGKIAHIRYDMPDLAPGLAPDLRIFQQDPRRLLGNAVAISHANGEFSYYGHLRQASLEVHEGQMVKRGALLGYVGNSGQSPGPHLHFHLQEGPYPFLDQGLPVKFSNFGVADQFFTRPMVIPTRTIVFGPEEPA
ncbi:MAG: M23 family metallopeptidase [Caldilineaceae bacterium]|nr:M23 family metallopeptidase [Caldilineaceae bacterium]